MKKLFILAIALVMLSACQKADSTSVSVTEAEEAEANITNAVPVEFRPNIEEVIITQQANVEDVEVERKEGQESQDEEPARVVDVLASRFEFKPSVIRAKQNEKVMIKIDNLDTTHNFLIPDLNEYSNVDEFLLDTSQKGEFPFFCATFCGVGHADMNGTIIIE